MTIIENTIILPTPTEELVSEKEKKWRLRFPEDYKQFLMNYNGGIPQEKTFFCENREYAITRFLCIIKNIKETNLGWYDIGVVESQIGERLTNNEDLIGIEVLPIAELFAGDYLCLDFREDKNMPRVCIWSHEESREYEPMIYCVADSFTEFLTKLG